MREAAVLAAEEDQRHRVGVLAHAHGENATDDDHMVAAIIVGVARAFERREAVSEQRRAVATFHVPNAFPFVGERTRKPGGGRVLVLGQHIDGEMGHRLPGREGAGGARHAEQDERRIDRDRIERAHGRADALALPAHGGHHGDAGGEKSERFAKIVRRKCFGRCLAQCLAPEKSRATLQRATRMARVVAGVLRLLPTKRGSPAVITAPTAAISPFLIAASALSWVPPSGASSSTISAALPAANTPESRR